MEKNDLFQCPICKGTGFKDGKICICIAGLKDSKESDAGLDALLDIFGLKEKKR